MSGQLTNMYLRQTSCPLRLDYGDGHVTIIQKPRPAIICKDGFSMSVQASDSAYCSPRTTDAAWYDACEVWCLSSVEPLLDPYGNGEDPYGYVPVEVIDNIIIKHGDIDETKY